MFSQTVTITFALCFISVVSGLEQRAAYEATYKCYDAGHNAMANRLRKDGMDATREEMIAVGCLFDRVSFDFKGLAIVKELKGNYFTRTKNK